MSSGTSEGQISTLRSIQKPNADTLAIVARNQPVFFGRWPSRHQNGITQMQIQANSVTFTHGSPQTRSHQPSQYQVSFRNSVPRRAPKNCVSSGRLPYQITRYCEKNRYIQKIEKAKIILPRSWSRLRRDLALEPGVVAVQHGEQRRHRDGREEAAPREERAEQVREPGRA